MVFFYYRLRRINPLIFLTICSVFLVLIIFAALITFTFLPIFQKTKGDQTKYQGIVYLKDITLSDSFSISIKFEVTL
jgi:hypothetical protein